MSRFSRKMRSSFDCTLRVFMCLWMPLWLCSCNVGGTGGGGVPEGQDGDPHTITVTDNTTGRTMTFHLHEDTDADQLVMALIEKDDSTSGQEEEEELVLATFAIDRSILADVVVHDLEGNMVGLHHPGRGEYHPGVMEVVQSSAVTGDLIHAINYRHPERGHDFSIIALTDGDKADASSQVIATTATVIIVVASLAAAVCMAELVISAIKTDCSASCNQTCGSRGVDSCTAKVGAHFMLPLNVDCSTECIQKCHSGS